jgi:hypothetical protein
MREHRRGLSTPLRLADADGPGKASTARSSKLPSSSELPVEITTPSPATAEWWLIESRQRCQRTDRRTRAVASRQDGEPRAGRTGVPSWTNSSTPVRPPAATAAAAASSHGGCCTKGSEKLWNLTGGRRIAIHRTDEVLVPLRATFGRPDHGSSHHRSTHRICGWFVQQPPWNSIAPAALLPCCRSRSGTGADSCPADACCSSEAAETGASARVSVRFRERQLGGIAARADDAGESDQRPR